MQTFQTYADYEFPLLEVLAGLPDGQGTAKETRDRFAELFDNCIPDEHRVFMESVHDVKWRNIVAWTRSALMKRGLVDAPAYGIWRITEAGRSYLAQAGNPTPFVSSPPTARSVRTPNRTVARTVEGRLVAGENKAAMSQNAHVETLARVYAIVDARIAEVRDFLNGRAGRPSDERLCDWVHLCYEFELFREGWDLFALVDPIQVNPWYYGRAKRLAKVCGMKMAGRA